MKTTLCTSMGDENKDNIEEITIVFFKKMTFWNFES